MKAAGLEPDAASIASLFITKQDEGGEGEDVFYI
jgi:hypothetical protein